MILSPNLRVSWKPVNPQECVRKNLYQHIMRTILQEKGPNSLQHYNLVHTFILMPQTMKIPAAKAAVDKEWEKLEKIPAWDVTIVRNESEVIHEARMTGIKVHFVSLMDICHLKNAELETNHQKLKGRVVLRGDIVKDDTGSYAVFTEQGSSASQITAAKVMDIISRLPGAQGQTADATSVYTQVKMEDAPKILKSPKSECPALLDPSTATEVAKIMIQYGRPSRSSWTKSVRSSFGRIVVGKAMLIRTHCKGLFLSVFVDDIKLLGKKKY